MREGRGSSSVDSLVLTASGPGHVCSFVETKDLIEKYEPSAGESQGCAETGRALGRGWGQGACRPRGSLGVPGASPSPPLLPRQTQGRGTRRAAHTRILAEPSVSSLSGGQAPGGRGALVRRKRVGDDRGLPRARGPGSAS